jgi:5-hydroxytryptamine receptor 1
MPIAVLKEVTRSWVLGSIICDAWVMIDLLCCTASILHLVAIALDRYWAITNRKLSIDEHTR